MKIVCTLKEFELLIARCPMYNYLLSNEKSEEYLNQCFERCVMYGVCEAGSDANWSFSDMVEIVPANN
jgi:hypothetical protein